MYIPICQPISILLKLHDRLRSVLAAIDRPRRAVARDERRSVNARRRSAIGPSCQTLSRSLIAADIRKHTTLALVVRARTPPYLARPIAAITGARLHFYPMEVSGGSIVWHQQEGACNPEYMNKNKQKRPSMSWLMCYRGWIRRSKRQEMCSRVHTSKSLWLGPHNMSQEMFSCFYAVAVG